MPQPLEFRHNSAIKRAPIFPVEMKHVPTVVVDGTWAAIALRVGRSTPQTFLQRYPFDREQRLDHEQLCVAELFRV
jgi:hypothetical protein